MNPRWKPVLAERLAPLSLAAYAAWGAVWLSLDPLVARDPQAGWIARVGALGFLLGFVAEDLICARASARFLAVYAGVMTALALLPVALAPFSAAPILLVLLAALLASRFEGRSLWLALISVNIAFAWAAWHWWPRGSIAISVAAYASFQLFAALVTGYARRAEELAGNLQAINAELLTTRTLLAEAARDHERLNLSRELHDVAGHSLTALKLNLGALARDPRQPDPQRVALCSQLADELLQNLRAVVQAMRRDADSDIQPALQRLAAPFPRPALRLQVDEAARWLRPPVFEAVLRAVQEALTNAARHGQARQLRVALHREGDELLLEIEDDGRMPAPIREGGGLSGMRERFESLHGSLQIDASPTGGLRLRACCPLQAPA